MNFKYLLYRLQWWWVDKTGLVPKSPINVDIELAGKCNLKCSMCSYGLETFDKSKQGMMPKAMAYKVLNEASDLGVKAIKFNFRGEPGLHKDLAELVKFAKSLNFVDVFINTNMLAFTEKRLVELAGAGLDKIIVSVDGADKETYEKVRVGGNFDKLLLNIKRFKHLSTTKVILQMVGEKPDPRLKDIPADGYRFVKIQDRSGKADNKRERRRCPQPRQRLVVGWDGTIFGCCHNWLNEYPLGNINKTTLDQAWDNQRMQALREMSIKCDSGPCRNCQVGVSYK